MSMRVIFQTFKNLPVLGICKNRRHYEVEAKKAKGIQSGTQEESLRGGQVPIG